MTFLASKQQIENELGIGEPLDWQDLTGSALRIRLLHPFTFADSTTWNEAFDWLSRTAIRFKKVFSKNWKKESTQQ